MDTWRSQWVAIYTYCTALQMEGSQLRVHLQDWSTSSALRGSLIGADLTWASPTPCWSPSMLVTASPFASYNSLFLINVSTSQLSLMYLQAQLTIHKIEYGNVHVTERLPQILPPSGCKMGCSISKPVRKPLKPTLPRSSSRAVKCESHDTGKIESKGVNFCLQLVIL